MNENIKRIGIKTGLFLGLVLVIIVFTIYFLDIKYFANTLIGTLNFVLLLSSGIYCSIKSKNILKNDMKFKEAFTAFILPIIIGWAIYVLALLFIFNFFDSEAKELIMNEYIAITKEVNKNLSKEKLDQLINNMTKEDPFSFINQIKAYFRYILIYSVIGLLVALIFKNPSN